MFGLDEHIAALSTGASFGVVIVVAILLGLRHATDPDHLTAVSTLVASGEAPDSRRAGVLGFSWGLGHATTLILLGLPIVLFESYLPETAVRAAEVTIGVVIIGLALRLLIRLRQGSLHVHPHPHPGARTRSPLTAYGIGLIHGIGGSAGVGILLLAAIPNHVEGIIALLLFGAFSAVSMALASTSFGFALSRESVLRRFAAVAPVLGALSLAFGVWYSLGALEAVPYVF